MTRGPHGQAAGAGAAGPTPASPHHEPQKAAHREYMRLWRAAHRDQARATANRYAESHREALRGRSNKRYQEMRPHHGKVIRAEYLARMAVQTEQNRESRRERNLARQRAYYQAHREREAERYRLWREANLHVGREKARRRRARARGVLVERYSDLAIFARDGWMCELCGEPVDATLPGTHPLGPTIDHIIPIVSGGADAPHNVQLAHLRCNVRKGAHLEAVA